ncbi:hypothetical protein [Serratia fonticola]
MKTNFQLLPPEGQAAALEVIKARLSSPGMSAAGASEVKKITEIFMSIYGVEQREEKAADVGKDGTAQYASELIGQSKSVRQHIINLSAQVDTTDLDKLEAQLKRIADLQQGIESPRSFLTREGEQRIREAINKAITKALQQGGSFHKSMRR